MRLLFIWADATDRAHLRVSAVNVRLPSNKSTVAVSAVYCAVMHNVLEKRDLCRTQGLKAVNCRLYALLHLPLSHRDQKV
jgi:hypothetical protein